MTDISKRRVIAVIIDNEFGALARVVELFSARGYNIETLSVAPISNDKKLSRITITTFGTDKTIELICKLLCRIVPVHHSAELSKDDNYIERELCLAQIICSKEMFIKAKNALDNFRFDIIDTEEDSTVFEIIGSSNQIDEALTILNNYGLATVSRTGIAGGFKGKKRLDRLDKI
ncbi:MAG: acetolactate synthase small subunit [Alphaproteobacteria bacterium]|nr:acetolactate synthase small subunit [Alphaproteobacteria bacterium]